MAPVQRKIEQELRSTREGLSVNELVGRIASSQTSEQEVRSAVLPMISSDRVELTSGLKLRLRSS